MDGTTEAITIEAEDNNVTNIIITIVTLILCSISSLLVYKYSV